MGSGFGEMGCTPSPRVHRSTPPFPPLGYSLFLKNSNIFPALMGIIKE